MPMTRFIVAQLVGTCLFVAGASSLHAQARLVTDDSGVTVNLNESHVIHRSPVRYAADALAKGVVGTVVAQVTLNANGEVTQASVLSGPGELRKSVQESVVAWHFDHAAPGSTRVINIDFAKPTNTVMPMVFNSLDPLPSHTTTEVLITPATSSQTLAPRSGIIDQIDVTGLSDAATAELLGQFPVHSGDPFIGETLTRATESARQFDPHLTVAIHTGPTGANIMNIVPAPSPPSDNPQSAILVSGDKPFYPPLAKMARQQGTVKLTATIGKDGAVTDVKIISGPPLLVQSASESVRTWVYQPTTLGESWVEVLTAVDVIFKLANDPDDAAATAAERAK